MDGSIRKAMMCEWTLQLNDLQVQEREEKKSKLGGIRVWCLNNRILSVQPLFMRLIRQQQRIPAGKNSLNVMDWSVVTLDWDTRMRPSRWDIKASFLFSKLHLFELLPRIFYVLCRPTAPSECPTNSASLDLCLLLRSLSGLCSRLIHYVYSSALFTFLHRLY